ncbi:MAG: ribosome maturation factor RimM [Campylobacterota bacterium]|nr:ribosome maturation factor RimM [Campylobacterota bacterium]
MDRFIIAQIGKTVGLWGELKFHLYTDFPEQFKIGQTYQSGRGSLEILDIDQSRALIKFRGYETVESAKKLTNTKLYADKKQTLQNCILSEGEHFWFDMIGVSVLEDDEVLGSVTEIQRWMETDYLLVQTNQQLVNAGMPSSFLIPYIPRYIIEMDSVSNTLLTQDTKEILEAS